MIILLPSYASFFDFGTISSPAFLLGSANVRLQFDVSWSNICNNGILFQVRGLDFGYRLFAGAFRLGLSLKLTSVIIRKANFRPCVYVFPATILWEIVSVLPIPSERESSTRKLHRKADTVSSANFPVARAKTQDLWPNIESLEVLLL